MAAGRRRDVVVVRLELAEAAGKMLVPGGKVSHAYRVFMAGPFYSLIFGSSQSRNESPNRLKANTARLIATPGKIIIHGAC